MLLNPKKEVYSKFVKKPSPALRRLFSTIIAIYKDERLPEHVPLEDLKVS